MKPEDEKKHRKENTSIPTSAKKLLEAESNLLISPHKNALGKKVMITLKK